MKMNLEDFFLKRDTVRPFLPFKYSDRRQHQGLLGTLKEMGSH